MPIAILVDWKALSAGMDVIARRPHLDIKLDLPTGVLDRVKRAVSDVRPIPIIHNKYKPVIEGDPRHGKAIILILPLVRTIKQINIVLSNTVVPYCAEVRVEKTYTCVRI